jgi:DNA primase
VRSQARITDLFPLSELRRSGSGYLATCPWHQDRRPSLTVNPERNRVHCFVCNKGADPIAWLEDRQGFSFREAVEELARRYAIPLPEQDPEAAARAEAEHQERQRLRQWRSQQEEEFHQALLSDLQASGPAASYLQQRGISPETAIAWRLGLNGSRLMLPIRDGQGRCCGFSGRSLTGEEPKYRNSSADLLFQKSQLLFGLDQAAAAIHSTGEALLVEGPLDVIQLHQAGFTTGVAAMGTALTLEQLQLLQRRGARRLLVVFDGDGAGRRATGKLIAGLRSAVIGSGLELAVVELPSGTDPDGLIRSHGPDALRLPIEQARHWLQWELDQLLAPLKRRHRQPVGSAALRGPGKGAAGRVATRGSAGAGRAKAPRGPGRGAPAAPWRQDSPGQMRSRRAAPGAPTSAQLSGITTTRPWRRCTDRAGRIPGPAPVPLQPRLPRSPGGPRHPP